MKTIILLIVSSLLLSLVYGTGQIDIAYSPYTISQPGSYIVVKNLTVGPDLNCITINTSDVSIDLNGHTLYGAGTTTGSTGNGVALAGFYDNIAVFNGITRDFFECGVNLGYYFSANDLIYNIHSFNNNYVGILLSSGIVRDCVLSGNYRGIIVDANGVVKNNTVTNNSDYGIAVSAGSSVIDNSLYYNGTYGIIVEGTCTLTGNSIVSNGSDGISASYYGSTITGNSLYNNSGNGITSAPGCTIKDNVLVANAQDGIVVASNCQVTGNTISGHLNSTYGRGINVQGTGTRIDSNHIANNRIGINFSSNKNWYGRNTFSSDSGGNTSGTPPADPGSPYTNQSY